MSARLIILSVTLAASSPLDDRIATYVNFGAPASSPTKFDCAKWVALFSPNGTAIAPGAPPSTGAAALRQDCEGTHSLFSSLTAFAEIAIPAPGDRVAFHCTRPFASMNCLAPQCFDAHSHVRSMRRANRGHQGRRRCHGEHPRRDHLGARRAGPHSHGGGLLRPEPATVGRENSAALVCLTRAPGQRPDATSQSVSPCECTTHRTYSNWASND